MITQSVLKQYRCLQLAEFWLIANSTTGAVCNSFARTVLRRTLLEQSGGVTQQLII